MVAPCTKGSKCRYHTTFSRNSVENQSITRALCLRHCGDRQHVEESGIQQIWGNQNGCGGIFLAGLGYRILRPENIEALVPYMPTEKKKALQQMGSRLFNIKVDTDMYVVAPRQQSVLV